MVIKARSAGHWQLGDGLRSLGLALCDRAIARQARGSLRGSVSPDPLATQRSALSCCVGVRCRLGQGTATDEQRTVLCIDG